MLFRSKLQILVGTQNLDALAYRMASIVCPKRPFHTICWVANKAPMVAGAAPGAATAAEDSEEDLAGTGHHLAVETCRNMLKPMHLLMLKCDSSSRTVSIVFWHRCSVKTWSSAYPRKIHITLRNVMLLRCTAKILVHHGPGWDNWTAFRCRLSSNWEQRSKHSLSPKISQAYYQAGFAWMEQIFAAFRLPQLDGVQHDLVSSKLIKLQLGDGRHPEV